MRTAARLLLLGLLLAGLAACAFRDSIRNYDFGDGYSIRIWWQYRAIWDWDDVPEPHLYYEVTRNGQPVVPKTWLSLDTGEDQEFDIATAVADGGNLVCVYDRNAFKGLFILFDVRSGDSWSGRFSTPEAEARWAKRYRQLLAENPGFPRNRLRSFAPEPIDHRDWAGRYEFTSDLGPAADGTPRTTSYFITVAMDEVWDAAAIRSVGYSSAEQVRCTTEAHGNRLDLFFHSAPGEPLYYQEQRLLSLERTGPADSPTYKVTWGKYRTVDAPTVVFKKVS
jgi:hypothetical protein